MDKPEEFGMYMPDEARDGAGGQPGGTDPVAPEDAEAAEAAFFSEAAAALEDGAEYRLITPLAASAERAVACAAQRCGSGEAYYDACRQIASAVIDVTSRHYEAVASYWKKEQKKHRRSPEALAGAEMLFADCVNAVAAAAKQTAGAVLEHAQDLSAANEFFWDSVMTLLDNAQACRFAAEQGKDPEIDALLDEIDRLRGNVFGEYAGVEELPEDEGEYVETVCPHCGETLSFAPAELADGNTVECPFCGGMIIG